LEKFFDRITPWLFDLGVWFFGSLLAFNLLILAALLNIGPVDRSVKAAAAAFAFALPLNVAGLFLLRVVRELKDIKLEDELARAFLDAGFSGGGHLADSAALEALRRRRTQMVLGVAPLVLALSVLLTLAGLLAALWHVAWWIAIGFLGVLALSVTVVVLAVAGLEPRTLQRARDKPKNRTG
jgi:uncharacterized membrane protein YcjF (UPF0283 family)